MRHPLDHKTQGAERTAEKFLAREIHRTIGAVTFQFESVLVAVHWAKGVEGCHASAARWVPPKALDGGDDLGPVRRELLHRARTTAGTNDADEIRSERMLLYEFLESTSQSRHAFEREAEIVYQYRYGSTNLFRMAAV